MSHLTFMEWPPRITKAAAGLVVVVGITALLGWQLDLANFKAVVPGWPLMAPSTSLLLILAGLGLWCAHAIRTARDTARVLGPAALCSASRACAAAAVFYGTLRLAMHAMRSDFPLDQLWFGEAAAAGTMGTATAVGFILLGGALFLATSTRFARVFQSLAMLGGLLACMGLGLYFFGGQPLLPFRAMAAHTALSLLLLSFGILATRPDIGLISLCVSNTAGGVMVRRLVPWALSVPPVLAWFRVRGEQAGFYGLEAGTALFALSTMVIFMTLLWATAARLHSSDTKRRAGEVKLHTQLGRLQLLQHITRAIGERQDLQSIFQVVIRSLEENLPLDFSCVCLYDRADQTLTVTCVGARSQALGDELALTERSRIAIDQNGLAHCLLGHLVHEPDISQSSFPFPQRLARGGLGSLVFAPLLVESHVFGVLVAARRDACSFTSPDCEFLRQLSEHVALAAHQAQIYTALQQAYDDLRITQESVMQQERLRALGQMASGIAHDINNALSPVTLYTESLLETEPALTPGGRQRLKTIERAVDDVAQTVARMREFYRQREPQLVLAAVDLNALARQVADLTRACWHDIPLKRGMVINLLTELLPDLPVIMGVESEIREALTNLVFNAVDAMPAGGTLTLCTRVGARDSGGAASPERVRIEVADTGAGMDEKTRQRCAEPFFTTKGERGTGLGLAMVYGMVRRHSADIEIESQVGQGTTVRLIFLAPTGVSGMAGGSAQPETEPAVPSRMRILVVDDDPILIKSLRDALEGDGHDVVTAGGGQAGIDAFRSAQERGRTFTVVITDLGMPYVDGRNVAAAIKAASPSTPVILLTGWGQRLAAEGDIPPHVDRVLSKPPKLRDLRQALTTCVSAAPITT